MGKAAKWLKQILTGKKERENVSVSHHGLAETRSGPIVMAPPPPEKRRWSFRRSVTGAKMEMEHKSAHARRCSDSDMYQKLQAVALTVAMVGAADAAVIRRTNRATEAVEEVAAVKIQSVFRSHLARKALSALKGLVKLQALIRGRLVRRQATATLRSMQAMVTAQKRAQMQRIQMFEEAQAMSQQRQSFYRKSPYEMEENIKIVEMDFGESQRSLNSYSYSGNNTPYRRDLTRESSPARSTIPERSPGAYNGHFIDHLSNSLINCNSNYALHPNYMAKTESSRAKARSHSAPKQRRESSERLRRSSIDGRSVSRGVVNMQRSIKLDKSSISLQDSECGSTSSLLMNTKYCRSLMSYEVCSELSFDIKK